MTPIDLLVAVPVFALFSFIWGSMQTELVRAKGYKRESPDLWVEKTLRVRKPKYPNIGEPIIPSDED